MIHDSRKEIHIMKILIVRHADPDYSIDSLTPTGWKEAESLSKRLVKLEGPCYYYVSPMGRARDTASLTLKKVNAEAVTCEWLREFLPRIARPDRETLDSCAWDWLPQDWTTEEAFYDKDAWLDTKVMRDGKVDEEYRWVIGEFDKLIAKHGYEREGNYYRAVRPNRDTLVFFCHFGLECVLLSRLLNISPMQLWHGTCAAPSSVTLVRTEERREGIASFRMGSFGDTSHLYADGAEPSFSARFCETYDDMEERHD